MHPEYDISIITINYHGIADTCEMIDSIPRTKRRLEVIVVDNGSTDNEADRLEERYQRNGVCFPVKIIRSDRNRGFAGANNMGIRKAAGKLIFLVNNDTLLNDTDIDALAERLEKDERIGAVSPLICDHEGELLIQYAGYAPLSKITLRNHAIGYGEKEHGKYGIAHPTPYLHGAAMMVRKEAIDKAGLMPECYFLYYEELDWSIMLRQAGYQLWFEPACTVKHKESRTTGKMSDTKNYFITRNRLLFAKRNLNTWYCWLAYAYQIGIVFPKNVVSHIVHKHPELARSTAQGIWDFLSGRKHPLES